MRRCCSAALVLSLALAACGGGDDDDASPPPTSDASESETTPGTGAPATTTTRPETYEVDTREETYVDETRPTDPNGDFAGAPDRTIRVVFHVPKGDGPFPVVVLSHGWIATPEIYEPVVTELARHGYLAVAPAYPLSNGLAPGGPTIRDVTNQPADASFVLDRMIAASADEASWLYGLVDAERIAAGGHSLGAFTTMGFFNSCCSDDRIDAAFPVAGSMPNYDGTWFDGVDTPLLVIHGDQDELVPYTSSERIYAEANSPKYFLTLLGGKHADFATASGTQQWDISVDAILAFLDVYLRGDDGAVDELAEIGNVDGVSTLVAS